MSIDKHLCAVYVQQRSQMLSGQEQAARFMLHCTIALLKNHVSHLEPYPTTGRWPPNAPVEESCHERRLECGHWIAPCILG